MIFLFSTSFTIHGSPRRSENSLEILKYLHGTCRYRISISLFVNFSIFSMGREGKECPKTCRIFSPINQISAFIYAPLNPPNSLHNQRPNGRTPSPRFDTYTRVHTQYTFTCIFAQKASPAENSTEAATTVWIPVYTSLYTNAEFLFE